MQERCKLSRPIFWKGVIYYRQEWGEFANTVVREYRLYCLDIRKVIKLSLGGKYKPHLIYRILIIAAISGGPNLRQTVLELWMNLSNLNTEGPIYMYHHNINILRAIIHPETAALTEHSKFWVRINCGNSHQNKCDHENTMSSDVLYWIW